MQPKNAAYAQCTCLCLMITSYTSLGSQVFFVVIRMRITFALSVDRFVVRLGDIFKNFKSLEVMFREYHMSGPWFCGSSACFLGRWDWKPYSINCIFFEWLPVHLTQKLIFLSECSLKIKFNNIYTSLISSFLCQHSHWSPLPPFFSKCWFLICRFVNLMSWNQLCILWIDKNI